MTSAMSDLRLSEASRASAMTTAAAAAAAAERGELPAELAAEAAQMGLEARDKGPGWFNYPRELLSEPVHDMLGRMDEAQKLAVELATARKRASSSGSTADEPGSHDSSGIGADGSVSLSSDPSSWLVVTPASAPFTPLGARLMPELLAAVRGFYALRPPSLLSAVAGVTGAVQERDLPAAWEELMAATRRGAASTAAAATGEAAVTGASDEESLWGLWGPTAALGKGCDLGQGQQGATHAHAHAQAQAQHGQGQGLGQQKLSRYDALAADEAAAFPAPAPATEAALTGLAAAAPSAGLSVSAALSSVGTGPGDDAPLLWGAEAEGISVAVSRTAPLAGPRSGRPVSAVAQTGAGAGVDMDSAEEGATSRAFGAADEFDFEPCHTDPLTGSSLPWGPLPSPAPASLLPWAAAVLEDERAHARRADTHPVLLGIAEAQQGALPLNVFLPTPFTMRCALRACRDDAAAPLWREALVLLDLMARLGMPLDGYALALGIQTCMHADREAEVVALVRMMLHSRVPLRVSLLLDLGQFLARRGAHSALLWQCLLWTLQCPAPTPAEGPRRIDESFLLNLTRAFVLEGYPMRAAALLLALRRVSPKTLSLYSALTHAAAQSLPRLDEVASLVIRATDTRYAREFADAHPGAVSSVFASQGPAGGLSTRYPVQGHFAPLSLDALSGAWTGLSLGLALYHQPAGLRLAVQLWARRQLVPLTHKLRPLDHLSMLAAVGRYTSSRKLLLALISGARPGLPLRLLSRAPASAAAETVPGRCPSPGPELISPAGVPRLHLHLFAVETLARFLAGVDVPMHNNPYTDQLRLVARNAELAFLGVGSTSVGLGGDTYSSASPSDASPGEADSLPSIGMLLEAAGVNGRKLPPMSPESLRATGDADVLRADHDGLPFAPLETAEAQALHGALIGSPASVTATPDGPTSAAFSSSSPYDVASPNEVSLLRSLWPYVRFVATSARIPPTKAQLTSLADQLWDLTVGRYGIASPLTLIPAADLAAHGAPATSAGDSATTLQPLRVSDGSLPLFSAARYSRTSHGDTRPAFPAAAALADAVLRTLPAHAAPQPSLWSAAYPAAGSAAAEGRDDDPAVAVKLAAASKHSPHTPAGQEGAGVTNALRTSGYVSPTLLDAPATGLVAPRHAPDTPGAPAPAAADAPGHSIVSMGWLPPAGFTGLVVNSDVSSHAAVLDLRGHSFATGVLSLRRAAREIIDWGALRLRDARKAGAVPPPGPGRAQTPQFPGPLIVLVHSHYSPAPHTPLTRMIAAIDLPIVLTKMGFPRAYLSSPVGTDPALMPQGAEGGPAVAIVIPAAAVNQWLYCAMQGVKTTIPTLAQDIENHFA